MTVMTADDVADAFESIRMRSRNEMKGLFDFFDTNKDAVLAALNGIPDMRVNAKDLTSQMNRRGHPMDNILASRITEELRTYRKTHPVTA